MDKKKIVIIILVVFAVLFFSGVAGNLVPKKRGGGGWEMTLGEWMAPFSPSLDVEKLLRNSSDCKSTRYKTKYKVILLNKTKDTCVIDIPKLKGEKYKKGKLTLVEVGTEIPDVTVLYEPEGKSGNGDEPKPISFKEEYRDKPDTKEKSLSLIVLEKGGKLTVACKGCFEEQERTIRVKFE